MSSPVHGLYFDLSSFALQETLDFHLVEFSSLASGDF